MTKALELHAYTAEVISPVHVGAGETLLPVDFFVHDGRLYVVNVEKLIDSIPYDRIEAFSDILIQTRDMSQVFKWLNIKPVEYGKYAKYSVPCNVQPGELRVFVKNIVGEPYIPGSSIKGALRTAICYNLFYNVQNRRWLISEVYKRLKWKNALKAVQDFVESVFGGERERHSSHFDVMRFFRISDSGSVGVNKVEVKRVGVIEASGMGRYRVSNLRIYVEALVPGLVAHGRITIDKSLSQEVYGEYKSWFPRYDVPTSLDTVISYANRFAADLIDYEALFASSYGIEPLIRFYEDLKGNVLQKLRNKQFLLRLGWGSGYFATTVGMLLKENEKVFSQIRRQFRLDKGHVPVFPMSRRAIFRDGEMVPLGWVKFTLV